MQQDQTLKFIALLEISSGNVDTERLVFRNNRTVIQRCNSWIDSLSKAGKRLKEFWLVWLLDTSFHVKAGTVLRVERHHYLGPGF